jgi:hypothetical protein
VLVGCGGGDIDTTLMGESYWTCPKMIVWLERARVDAYVELGGDQSAIRLAVYVMILDRDRHIGRLYGLGVRPRSCEFTEHARLIFG